MFLLWIGLCGAGLLCVLRDYLTRQSVAEGLAMVLALTVDAGHVISAVAYYFGSRAGWLTQRLIPTITGPSWCATSASRFVVTALALRYFYVTHEWRHNVELQAKARVHALQARIRPHFLFNSMNTIAALTRSNPARAEEAVQDLADLFRANLNEKRNQISLAEEIDVARTYQRMEQLRLGDRLRVDWKVDSLPARRAGARAHAAAAARKRHLSRRRAAPGRRRGHGHRRIQQGHDHHCRAQPGAARRTSPCATAIAWRWPTSRSGSTSCTASAPR